MTAEEWALAASAFFSGLAAGFLGGLCMIIRPMQAAMKGPEFRNFMENFLVYASNGSGKAFNYAWSGGMTIGPIIALVLPFDDPGSTSFILTAIGLAIVIVGILVVSNVWKTPTGGLCAALASPKPIRFDSVPRPPAACNQTEVPADLSVAAEAVQASVPN